VQAHDAEPFFAGSGHEGQLFFEIEACGILQDAVLPAEGEQIGIDERARVEHGSGFFQGSAAPQGDEIDGARSGAQKDDGSHLLVL